jgi:hypothetical protein
MVLVTRILEGTGEDIKILWNDGGKLGVRQISVKEPKYAFKM